MGQTRLSPIILNHRHSLQVDGSYSKCATLSNRLHFEKVQIHKLTWRHLWNYMSILVIALDTLNPSRFTIVRWKSDLNVMLSRLQSLYLPGINDAYDYQVDSQVLLIVHSHLSKLLMPCDTMSKEITLGSFLKHRQSGTIHMFSALFEYWNAPVSIIQLLARSYMPYIYLLHTVHDPKYFHDFELLTTFYEPIHASIAELSAFSEMGGNKEDYEVMLTFVDSHLLH